MQFAILFTRRCSGYCELPKRSIPRNGRSTEMLWQTYRAIGQTEKFKERYGQLQADFDKLDAQEVIVACQSCYGMIKNPVGHKSQFHYGNCFQKSVCQKRYAAKQKTVTWCLPFMILVRLATRKNCKTHSLDLKRAWLQNL